MTQDWTEKCSQKLELVSKFDMGAGGSARNKTNTIVFLKTHKTGSSSVQNILLRYGDKNGLSFVLPASGNHVMSRRAMPHWLRSIRPCERRDEKPDMFCLHTDYKPDQLAAAVNPNATFVTILREPDSLFHSMYR
jgi:hypothetical protein